MSTTVVIFLCFTAVDAEMLFEVVFVLESLPTLETLKLPGLHALIQRDGTLNEKGLRF